MYIPKGNILIDEVAFPFDELEPMMMNLQNDGFTGYIKITNPASSSYIFMNGGQMGKAIDVNSDTGSMNVYDVPRLMNRLRTKELTVSSFVLSSRMISVLSNFFTFQQHYKDYEVRRRDMTRVLEGLENGKSSGIIKVSTKNGVYAFLVTSGELLSDRFSRQYGEIICGIDELKVRLEEIEQYGAVISVYAEKDEEIENRRRQKDEELEKIRDVSIKLDGGFLSSFRSSDIVKVDEYTLREWGIDAKATFTVEIETQRGELFQYKCQASGKRMNSYAGVSKAMMEHMKVAENDIVSIRPV
ncbi:MAG: hypothetical protein Q4F00_11230 [bacterium]|nr:hypothetical protein [bacterium]